MKKTASTANQAPQAPTAGLLGQGAKTCPSHILARYRALLTVIDEAVIMADAATGIIVDVNEGTVRLTDLPRDQLIGRHHTILHPPGENDRHAAMFKDVVAATTNHDGLTVLDVNLRRGDGTVIPCQVSNILVEDEERPVIIGIFRDCTPEKEAKQALRPANGASACSRKTAPTPCSSTTWTAPSSTSTAGPATCSATTSRTCSA